MILHHPKPKPDPWSQVSANKSVWKLPFFATEHVFDWATYLLSNWAFLETLEYMGSLSILIAVVFYFAEGKDRVKQRHYQAWQVINTAQGKGGSGGRIEALQELDADGVPLTGVDVAGAYLYGIKLEHANLVRANFHNADVRQATFDSADFSDSDLRGANFREGSFRKTNLRGANLQDAAFDHADLDGADLSESNLENVDLNGADLRNVRWENMQSVKMANLQGAKNAPPEFVKWALQHGAVQSGAGTESAKVDGK
jgi:hypothetical protein